MFKFIVIDDEPYVIDLFPKLLNWKERGFELIGSFTSIPDALEYLQTNECDVIFTDIFLQDMLGTELAKICQTDYPDIIIVFFSAHSNFEYAYEAIKYNVFDYILKPISPAELIKTVDKLTDKLSTMHETNFDSYEQHIIEDETSVISLAKQFIEEHYNEDISVADIARHVNLSHGYFSTFYKKMTKETAISALKNYRLIKSKELLENETIKMSAIPHLIGFNSYSYFTKAFQNTFGETPTEYRIKIFNSKKGEQK